MLVLTACSIRLKCGNPMSFYKYNDDGTPRYTFSSDYVSSGLSYNVTEEAAERRRFITGLTKALASCIYVQAILPRLLFFYLGHAL